MNISSKTVLSCPAPLKISPKVWNYYGSLEKQLLRALGEFDPQAPDLRSSSLCSAVLPSKCTARPQGVLSHSHGVLLVQCCSPKQMHSTATRGSFALSWSPACAVLAQFQLVQCCSPKQKHSMARRGFVVFTWSLPQYGKLAAFSEVNILTGMPLLAEREAAQRVHALAVGQPRL
jgi:hypothetical protein